MLLLHTSDWHLGAPFHGDDRRGDEAAAMDRLVALCAARQVDAVLIAGDVFDTANPGADEQRRYFQALGRLVREGGVGSVVVIAGNHDSGARLDGPRDLLESLRISVRGVLAHDAPAETALVPLIGRDGVQAAWCLAVPYLRETDLVIPPGDGALASRQAQAMEARFAALAAVGRARAAADGLPLVAMAHAHVRGGQLGGAERPVLGETVSGTAPDAVERMALGRLGQVAAESLGESAAYLALGHLHRPQRIAGRDHWRYCGSLLPSGFDESATVRSVVLARIDGPGPATVELVALPTVRRYACVAGTPEAVREAIAALPPGQADEPPPLLMATVRTTGERAGLSAEVMAWAQARGWSALRIVREAVALTDPAAGAASRDEPAGLQDLEPIEVLRAAHRARHGGNPPHPDLETAFHTLLAEAVAAEAGPAVAGSAVAGPAVAGPPGAGAANSVGGAPAPATDGGA